MLEWVHLDEPGNSSPRQLLSLLTEEESGLVGLGEDTRTGLRLSGLP